MVLKYLQRIYIYIYKEDSKPFNINDIDIDKIRVSNKKHGSYKHYVFCEDGNEYIPLKITLLDVHGYYNVFKGGSKTMILSSMIIH